MKRDTGLDTFLDMDDYRFVYPNKYRWKIEAYLVEPNKERLHGIRYTLTVHNTKGTRIFGMDNAHVPKNRRKRYQGRIVEYDHVHIDENDRGTAYAFLDAETLMADFFKRVNEIMNKLE